ncbi:hypothetical protein GUITHDRAFT_111686 [Guillardia theta CCMP2712]|uniref:Uncharacterized protein n=1 Tax=Guillardia theta (strain CCMP2712) TaxID=905079 RepID=L1J2T9_GUITC|nr:hypothetical protein GUITHDRAFT_111686 [Guillardia theta CCMP2712]EKX42410.1 hypothetical protein GUITHDRAFT_111686 [Guillardia theta CCMP2712]|eukprot:XP_005829390.1 hypothetical protein GUITHDRAFT_111686 [Guillardia theta CCMP2712]
MPDSSCFLLAGFSLVQSAFPIYYAYSWANIDSTDTNENTHNTSLYKVFGTYVGVLWLLTIVNILAPLIGIGDDRGQRNFIRTIAFLLNLLGGLAVTVLGIWIIAAVFPTTACVKLGLMAASSHWACSAYHIISWMHFIIFCLLALFLILLPCLIESLKRPIHDILNTAGTRSICPDSIIDWIHSMLGCCEKIVLKPYTLGPIVPPLVAVNSYPVLTPVVSSPGVVALQPPVLHQTQIPVSPF